MLETNVLDVAAILSSIACGEVKTLEEDRVAFPRLGSVGAFGVFVGRFMGSSPWEIHREEELLYVLDGRTEVTLLLENREETFAVEAGQLFIVPAKVWHRQTATEHAALLAVVAEEGAVSFESDPRSETPRWT